MRAIKDQHRQRASLVSTDGAKVWETFVPDEFLRVGGKLEKEKEKEVHFFTPFWVLWRKFGESQRKFGESFAENFCENSPKGWWAFEENSLKFAPKNRMPPLRLPPWIHKTAHQRDIDLQGIIQSGHYVIMPLCHHAVKDFTGKRCIWAQRNSIYNINIIYTISLTSHIPFFLNGMMT